ncbi:MAG TPA: hypothetical protein VH743_17930 [Beijerinckiaceae bacterium]|jgi:hypothetical protein
MRKVFLLAAACLSLSACAYEPTATERIHIVDSPVDIRACARLGEVGGPVATSPGFKPHLDAMLAGTVALGGTDLYLQRQSRDWSYVRGIAYRCPFERRERIISTVVRAAG